MASQTILATLAALAGGTAIGLTLPSTGQPRLEAIEATSFALCHTGGGFDCVVDGDTFWLHGTKIRIANIDAPETHPSRCPEEEAKGNRATARLRDLLSGGLITLAAVERDEDRFGRKLRNVSVGGKDVGETLVAEGVARNWTGAREPWCEA